MRAAIAVQGGLVKARLEDALAARVHSKGLQLFLLCFGRN